LRDFLEGKDTITEAEATSYKECELGRWFYSKGMAKYHTIPEMQELERVHMELHDIVKEVIRLKKSDNINAAKEEFRKIEPFTKKIVTLLTILGTKIK
jgi:methyl-accepting chemotaxis protein